MALPATASRPRPTARKLALLPLLHIIFEDYVEPRTYRAEETVEAAAVRAGADLRLEAVGICSGCGCGWQQWAGGVVAWAVPFMRCDSCTR